MANQKTNVPFKKGYRPSGSGQDGYSPSPQENSPLSGYSPTIKNENAPKPKPPKSQ
ncbi:hypothetical protein [Bacterioplanoides sp.]|uniref:hypothetical protein n=1 Tax=Bacterioplanoides sp. TaxID=2066072 RepID=UPI003B5AD65F